MGIIQHGAFRPLPGEEVPEEEKPVLKAIWRPDLEEEEGMEAQAIKKYPERECKECHQVKRIIGRGLCTACYFRARKVEKNAAGDPLPPPVTREREAVMPPKAKLDKKADLAKQPDNITGHTTQAFFNSFKNFHITESEIRAMVRYLAIIRYEYTLDAIDGIIAMFNEAQNG
jgi:hypothetical protein